MNSHLGHSPILNGQRPAHFGSMAIENARTAQLVDAKSRLELERLKKFI